MAEAYQIVDEVGSKRFPSIVVNPVFPLVVVVAVTPYLAWLWFAINGFAFGSPSRWRELGIIVFGVVATIAVAVALGGAVKAEMLTARWMPYARIVSSTIAIGFSYWVFVTQSRSFEYYESLGGKVQNGLYIGLAVVVLYLFILRLA